MSTLNDKVAQLSPERRGRVVARGQEFIAEEMTLRELRQALNITQEQLADRIEYHCRTWLFAHRMEDSRIPESARRYHHILVPLSPRISMSCAKPPILDHRIALQLQDRWFRHKLLKAFEVTR